MITLISLIIAFIAILLAFKSKRKINEINEIRKANLIQHLSKQKYSDHVYFGHLNGRIERVL